MKLWFLFILFNLSLCAFLTSFFKEINKQYIGKNLIASTLSVYQIFGLIANGANGKYLEEFLLALGNERLKELNKINMEI